MEKVSSDIKKIKGKCTNCGASIKPTEKVCSYCGSINTEYVEPEIIKDINPPQDSNFDDFDFGGMLGSMMGGMMMGGMLKNMRRNRPRRKR